MAALSFSRVSRLIQRECPYDGFDYKKVPFQSVPEWHGSRLFLAEVVESLQPRLIIEVGSWKGDSAITMASALRNLAIPDSGIICVDTWLGALEFWADRYQPEHYDGLAIKNGYPQVFYQFLANVCHRELQDYITPFPQTSEIAAAFFLRAGITADLIYIDASHEKRFVYRDICDFWDVLAPGGVIFGDDFISVEDVRDAVRQFAGERNLSVYNENEFWVLPARQNESIPESVA